MFATIYLICLITGGLLVAVSIFFGGDDADTDSDVHAETDHGGDGDASGAWLPFFSLRFWIFSAASFGLTGTLFAYLTPSLDVWTGFGVALALGFFIGSLGTYAIRYLQKNEKSSVIPAREYVGRSAQVTVPIDNKNPGKIRLEIHNTILEVIASTQEDLPLHQGDTVFVIEYREGIALVARRFQEAA